MNEHSSNLDSIAHYGVKGMRWGVRRYQNSDGTLTSAGKEHYASKYSKVEVQDKRITRGSKLGESSLMVLGKTRVATTSLKKDPECKKRKNQEKAYANR